MDESSKEIETLTRESLRFLQDFQLNREALKRQENFNADEALKSFDMLLEKTILPLKNKKVALLFSGGLDSALLAYKLKFMKINYIPLLVARPNEADYKNAIEVASILGINLKIIELNIDILEIIIPKIMKVIETTEEKQINISAPFFLAAEYLSKNNINIAILGQGADELFCGYQRYVDYLAENSEDFKNYHLNDVKESVIKNYTRDRNLFSSQGIFIYVPYIFKEIVEFTFSIPNDILINTREGILAKKNFLRRYAQMLNLDEGIIEKKKVAIQFGSGSYKLLRKLANREGFTKKFAQQHGYLAHAQLYLDYIAQKNSLKDFNLRIDKLVKS